MEKKESVSETTTQISHNIRNAGTSALEHLAFIALTATKNIALAKNLTQSLHQLVVIWEKVSARKILANTTNEHQ